MLVVRKGGKATQRQQALARERTSSALPPNSTLPFSPPQQQHFQM